MSFLDSPGLDLRMDPAGASAVLAAEGGTLP